MRFAERELEDYIWSNPDSLGELLHSSGINGHGLVRLGRQVKCRSGIIDLLFYSFTTVYVVELKAIMADTSTLGQVSRYVTQARREMIPPPRKGGDMSYAELHSFFDDDVSIESVIVAPGFDDKIVAVGSSEINLILADKTDCGFTLRHNGRYCEYTTNASLIVALQPFHEHIVKVAQEKKDYYQQRTEA